MPTLKKKMNNRKSCFPWLLLILAALGSVAFAVFIPLAAQQSFGAPSAELSPWQHLIYSVELVWNAEDLVQPRDIAGTEQLFTITPGESVNSISIRLEEDNLILSAGTFRTYLSWTGMDTLIQPGTYRINPAQNGRDIAGILESATQTQVTFNILPGWRMEEIAASLPTSGLEISPDMFLTDASGPASPPNFLPVGDSAEGFLAPGRYVLSRTTTAVQLVSILLQRFSAGLTPEMRDGFSKEGFTVYQAVILASIIQREAVEESEMPLIASVFYNRLKIDMPLQSDPTVQYALGYNTTQGTWWTNPLSAADMGFNSPYNTYLYPNLPTGPISNPGLAALEAVANPSQSNYFFFQAKCDGSGLHNFAETFAQHQINNCP
jgi:UPF0755 protein